MTLYTCRLCVVHNVVGGPHMAGIVLKVLVIRVVTVVAFRLSAFGRPDCV